MSLPPPTIPHLLRTLRNQNLIADALAQRSIPKKKIIVDFSSPNIAKTFHIGNLRSTLYGNFVQKICRFAGHDVTSINYLGDWGHQFSLLALYPRLLTAAGKLTEEWPTSKRWTSEMSFRERVEFLTRVYVQANKKASEEADFRDRARELFAHMERSLIANGAQADAPPEMALWREWCDLSRSYLEHFYAQFGITFDEWHAESDNVAEGRGIAEQLIAKGYAHQTSQNNWEVPSGSSNVYSPTILMRGDGSTVYFTRDLGAIFARDKRFGADQYVYVVDRAQKSHFVSLKLALEALDRGDLAQKIQHLDYGRVKGLSTRSGKNDSVDFIIEQGTREALERLRASPTLRLSADELPAVSERLARYTIVFDTVRRNKNEGYDFSFKHAFDLNRDSAIFLLEKYTRLNSLECTFPELMERIRTMDDSAAQRLTLDATEHAESLARDIGEFDAAVYASYERLEPVPLTQYLLKLCRQTGKSMASLLVRGEPEAKALPRLILFTSAKKILGDGMKLIGIEPFDRM